MSTTRLRGFCLLSRNACRFLHFRAKIVISNHYIYPQLLVQRILFTSITIMPPKRKIESKKAEKVDVKGNGDTMDNVEISKGRGRRANTVKPDKVVEEMEEVVIVKKGQKKEAAPVEEPKTRGRKAKAEKELVPLPASKASSPTSNKRGRKVNAKAEEETVDVDDNDEPPVKKLTKKGMKAAKELEVEAPTKGRRGKKPKAAVLTKESSTEEESEEEKVEEKKMNSKKQLKADIVTKDGGNDEEKVEEKVDEKVEEKVEEKKKKPTQQGDEEKNTTETNFENIDFFACEKNPRGEDANMKIACWNVGGVRAWLKKDGMQYITNESPDILCFQETKCSEKKLPEDFVSAVTNGTGKYHMYWLDGQKEGYAGVAMFTRTKPLSVSYGIENQEMDKESRCITAQFRDYYVINVYVPNAGRGLVSMSKRLEWNEAFRAYVNRLDAEKPVIICGDMNVAHNEIDLKNPKSNKKNAGFTPEEREGMTTFLADGYVDAYRSLYPEEKDCYTFWSYMSNARNKNVGWRLDYFLVSTRFMENVCDTKIRSTIFGSDHCPLTLHLNCDVE